MSLIDFNDEESTTEVKVTLDVNKSSSAFNENLIDMGFEVKNPLFSDEIYGKNNQQLELKHKELSIETLLFTTVKL